MLHSNSIRSLVPDNVIFIYVHVHISIPLSISTNFGRCVITKYDKKDLNKRPVIVFKKRPSNIPRDLIQKET